MATLKHTLYQIVNLLVDTCATNRKMLRIAGDDKPAEVVRSRFIKLNADHIRFVLKCLAENSNPIRNMKQYLLASLYNAPTTMQLSYQNQTTYDFGQYKVNDKAYNKLGFSIHNYFFAKAIDQVRPGGIVAFVTSRYTMDSKDSTARKHMAERADLLGAIRLPNNAFKANAGTEVVSDIIFLQKRDRPADIEPDWVQLGKTEDGFAINQYFVDHPEMVLGELTTESTQYGREELTVAPLEGANLADQLAEAVQHIEGQYTAAEVDAPDIAEEEAARRTLPADPDVKNFSYTVVDGEVLLPQRRFLGGSNHSFFVEMLIS